MEQFCIADISKKAIEMSNKMETYQKILDGADEIRKDFFEIKSNYKKLYEDSFNELIAMTLDLSEKIKSGQIGLGKLKNVYCRQRVLPEGIDYANGMPSSYQYCQAFCAYGRDREFGFFESRNVSYLKCTSPDIVEYEKKNFTHEHKTLIRVNDKTPTLTPDLFVITFTFFYYKYNTDRTAAVKETKKFFEEYRPIGSKQPRKDLYEILFKEYVL